MSAPVTREWEFEGQRLVYDEYGSGSRTLVLIHGLLLSRKMHGPLAQALAERGNRVICPDMLGHGASDRPRDMWRYSMPLFADQTLALMDQLGVDDAVVGGTSLGANISLEVASKDASRLRGMFIEMPVLDNALLGCAIAFAPLLLATTFGAPFMRAFALGARQVPRGASYFTDLGLDAISQDPGPSSAVLQGLFFGRVAPPRAERRLIETKALVFGHPRDPIHPFSDSDMLVREMKNARLVEAGSIVELRFSPDRLTTAIARFLDECWRPRRASGRKARRAS